MVTRNEANASKWWTRLITYNVATEDRFSLSDDLAQITEAVFKVVPDRCDSLHHEYPSLLEAFRLIGKENPNTILYRSSGIRSMLDYFPDLINDLFKLAIFTPSGSQQRKIVRKVRKYVKDLNNLTNLRLTSDELAQFSITAYTNVAMSVPYYRINTVLWERVSMAAGKNRYEETRADHNDPELGNRIKKWLHSFSPDVRNAYIETESLIREVESIASAAEDKYFLEQIAQDYYPHIFTALERFSSKKASYPNKESIVNETLKQFQIIQIGLHKIINKIASNDLDAIRSQTEFLRNKVLGPNSLSLTGSEEDKLLETSEEESNRLREDLYNRHVTSVLEKIKQENENFLAEQAQEYQKSLAGARRDYQKQLAEVTELHQQELAKQQKEYERQMRVIEGNWQQDRDNYETKLRNQRQAFLGISEVTAFHNINRKLEARRGYRGKNEGTGHSCPDCFESFMP